MKELGFALKPGEIKDVAEVAYQNE
jgi:hypothetical protein